MNKTFGNRRKINELILMAEFVEYYSSEIAVRR